jgi:hypothetical protein
MQRTIRRPAALVALGLTAALAACGAKDDQAPYTPTTAHTTTTENPATSATPPPCGDVFIDGKVVTDTQWQIGCKKADGTTMVGASYEYDCGTAWQNDLGWGYANKPFHAGQPLPGLSVIAVCGQP